MIVGSTHIPRTVERSYCRSSEDTYFTKIADYKIHSTALMTNIPFGEAEIVIDGLDSSVFINAEETKLTFSSTIRVQNYLTTRYIGRAPLTYYGPKTKKGHRFWLICPDGNPTYRERYFGTEGAIGVNNPNANEQVTQPR